MLSLASCAGPVAGPAASEPRHGAIGPGARSSRSERPSRRSGWQHPFGLEAHFFLPPAGGSDRRPLRRWFLVGTGSASWQPSADQSELCGQLSSWRTPLCTGARFKLVVEWSPSKVRSFSGDSAPFRPPHHPHGTSHHHSSRTNALFSTHSRCRLGDATGAIGRGARK